MKKKWTRFWMRYGGITPMGKVATRMALIPVGAFRHRYPLATFYPKGFTAPDAEICRTGLVRGDYVYIGRGVVLFRQKDGGKIVVGDNVFLNDHIRIETGFGGAITIGDGTHIQPACQFSAYLGNIAIGRNVQIAPRCAFYPYDHGIAKGRSMMAQPLVTKGGIVVKDEAWIGYGAIVLDNVTIGNGAVVGAGSVVTKSVPDLAVCAGVPSRIIGYRQ